MPKYDFDLFAIGAGSGGVAASRRAGAYGAKVGLCEESRVGGTCVLRGCVPKKLLMYGSMFATAFEDAVGFGWNVGEATFDWGKLVARKDEELERLEGVYHRMLRDAEVAVVDGRGVIVDPHTVEVDGKRYTTERILVATGGWPKLPEIHGIEHVITSNEALDIKQLPERMVIVGAGYIGVEFAGIFNAAGVDVTMLVRSDGVLRGFDQDIRGSLRAEMERRGITVSCETAVHSIEKENGDLSIRLAHEEMLDTDLVMYATGRAPSTRNLGLEEVGVRMRESGAIEVDEHSRTSVDSIYAIGDVTDRHNLTPVAIAEGRALAETWFNQNPMVVSHENIPTAVFSQPQVGTVGLTEEQARHHYEHVDIYRVKFRSMKHTLSGRSERTLMKLIVNRENDRVLGCHMVGEDAAEIVQGLGIALQCGATKSQFDATMGIHPTAAEEFTTMREPVHSEEG